MGAVPDSRKNKAESPLPITKSGLETLDALRWLRALK